MAQLSDDCFAFGGPLMTVDDAARLMAERVEPVSEIDHLPLMECDGRVLARDVLAPLPLPPFRNAAVDGYAVRFADLAPDAPTTLPVSDRVPAGASAARVSAAGRAVRIFTGAPMPEDADTVFMQEDVRLQGPVVVLPAGLKRGANMRPAGEDIAQGALALPAGQRLRPQDLATVAALGLPALPVRRRLKVGVMSTGDEIVEPGAPLPPAAIYDSNRVLLKALAARAGAEVIDLGQVRDNRQAIAQALREAARQCDLILTSGGVSTGEEDHVKPAVESIGRLVFWRVAIKPGRPVAMGVIDGAAFMGLPGNPVAVFVTFAFVVRPLLARMGGATWREPRRIPVTAGFAYKKKLGRREFVRVSLSAGAEGLIANKHPRDGAGVLSSLTETDGLLELAEDRAGLQPGETAPFIAYNEIA